MSPRRLKRIRIHRDDLDIDEIEAELLSRGWTQNAAGEWAHKNLASCWPASDALRLQDEADAGMMDKTRRALRGEET